MGLFDNYVNPQQFNNGGGLLGRLFALPQFQGQFPSDADPDQEMPTPSPSPSMLLPLLSGYDQAQTYGQPASSGSNTQYQTSPSVYNPPNGPNAVLNPVTALASHIQANLSDSTAANGAATPPSSSASVPDQNTTLAQYSPAKPAGIFVPPNVFLPGTPENDAFSHWAIGQGRAIGNAIGNLLKNESSNDSSEPITPRPDIPSLAGGRSGEYVPGLTGPPNSAITGGPGRIFITDSNGNVIVDLTGKRAKDITPGGGAGPKREPTPQEQELLKKMGR